MGSMVFSLQVSGKTSQGKRNHCRRFQIKAFSKKLSSEMGKKEIEPSIDFLQSYTKHDIDWSIKEEYASSLSTPSNTEWIDEAQ